MVIVLSLSSDDILGGCIHVLNFQVDIYESRFFIGGKVGSFVDKRGNHIEMGLHVFFGCYNNVFRLLKKVNIFYFLIMRMIMCFLGTSLIFLLGTNDSLGRVSLKYFLVS